jgi:hypothetical protein
MVLRVVRDYIGRRHTLRQQLHLFETKKIWISEAVVSDRQNATQDAICEIERQKAELDDLLKECKPPVYQFASKTFYDRYGFCERRTGGDLPAWQEWYENPGGAIYLLATPKLGKIRAPIESDINRWGFCVLAQGNCITDQF